MNAVTVSPIFQVVIPKEIRGFLKGIDTEVTRGNDRI